MYLALQQIRTNSMFSLHTWRLCLLLITFHVRSSCMAHALYCLYYKSFSLLSIFFPQQLWFRHIIPPEIPKMTPCLETCAKLSSLSTSTHVSQLSSCSASSFAVFWHTRPQQNKSSYNALSINNDASHSTSTL